MTSQGEEIGALLSEPRRPVDTTRLRRGVAVLGLLGTAAVVLLHPHPVPYLVALGVAGIGLLGVATNELVGRRRAVAVVTVLALLVGAALGPWWWSRAALDGRPVWTTELGPDVSDVMVDGDRVLALGRSVIVAVGLSDGELLWSYDLKDRVSGYRVAADGYVLTISGRAPTETFTWLDPDGDALWQHTPDEGGELAGLNLRGPVASRDGALVAVGCPPGDGDTCRYVGIGVGGEVLWERDGYEGPFPALDRSGTPAGGPWVLPEVAVVSTEPDDAGAQVVAAGTGEVLHELDVAPETTVAQAGDVVVHSGVTEAADGSCVAHGWSADSSVEWSAPAPCLHREAGDPVVAGDMLYVRQRAARDDGRGRTALDMRTGTAWQLPPAGGEDAGTALGAQVVVLHDGRELTALDARSGRQRWVYEAPGEVAGLAVGPGAVVVTAGADGAGFNPWTAPRRRDGEESWTVLDVEDGRVTSSISRTVGWVTPAGDGALVRLDGEHLSLVGNPQD